MSNSNINYENVGLKDVILKLISIKKLLWQNKLKIFVISLIFGFLGSTYAYFKKENGPILDEKEISILEKSFNLKKRSDSDYGTDFILLEAIENSYENIK